MNWWFIDLNGSDKHVAWIMVSDLISACVLPSRDPAQGSLSVVPRLNRRTFIFRG